MNKENQPLLIHESVKFEKEAVEVPKFRKFSNHCRKIYKSILGEYAENIPRTVSL